MKTQCLLFSEDPERAAEIASETLAAGEVVALPTETVYGLAADACNGQAVAKIFAAKERPTFDPLIVHLPSLDFLEKVASISLQDQSTVANLILLHWPGPLTIVLPRTSYVAELVAAELPTVAVRLSAHPVFQKIIHRFNKPLAAPSANRFGRVSPTRAEHVLEELDGKIPLVIDGGPTLHGIESTIVLPHAGSIQILRHGPITVEQFQLPAEGSQIAGPTERPIAPGQLASHYAPETPFQLAEQGRASVGKRCGLLAWRGERASEFEAVEWLSRSGNLIEAAANLYSAMRALDSKGLDLIVAERVPECGIGTAILERLTRAAYK